MRMIPAYPDASANAPCTRTTVGLVGILSLLLRVLSPFEFRPLDPIQHHLNARSLFNSIGPRGESIRSLSPLRRGSAGGIHLTVMPLVSRTVMVLVSRKDGTGARHTDAALRLTG